MMKMMMGCQRNRKIVKNRRKEMACGKERMGRE